MLGILSPPKCIGLYLIRWPNYSRSQIPDSRRRWTDQKIDSQFPVLFKQNIKIHLTGEIKILNNSKGKTITIFFRCESTNNTVLRAYTEYVSIAVNMWLPYLCTIDFPQKNRSE